VADQPDTKLELCKTILPPRPGSKAMIFYTATLG